MREQIYDIYRDKKLTMRFGTIGGVGFLCNFGILKLCTSSFGLNKVLAEVIAALVALQVTFLLHDKWTYRIDETVHKYHLTFGRRYKAYLISNSFASLLTVVFFAVFSIFLSHFPALALAAIIGLLWNFLLNKNVIWHHKPHDKNIK